MALAVAFGLTGCEKDPVAVERVSLDKTALTLTRGESGRLEATVFPDDAEDKTVVWSSSDEAVVTVDDGLVKAVAVGKATVTVRAGRLSASCEVTVEGIPVTSVSLDRTECRLKPGERVTLVATVAPDDADDKTVVWSSSDEAVASVDDAGVVTALAEGDAVITALAGGAQASCTVHVAQEQPVVGDFFYSDGTWSAQLDETKEPIGIVFYTGDPSVHDVTLRRDYPACTHGLVVSLGEDYGRWMLRAYKHLDWYVNQQIDLLTCTTGTDGLEPDYLNKIMGYNNTRVIEAYNADEANAEKPISVLDGLYAYRDAVPAPEQTSDWYVPSAKELSLLCIGDFDENIYYTSEKDLTRRDLIQGRLAEVQGAEIQAFFYWSSSERTMQTAFSLFAGTGNTSYSYKDGKFFIRYVLAF